MAGAVGCGEQLERGANEVDIQEFIDRVMELPKRKLVRVAELMQLCSDAESEEEKMEIRKIVFEIVHPVLIGLPWRPGTTGTFSSEVPRATFWKLVTFRRSVGATIAKIRKEKGLTQKMLAEAAGIPQSHISRIEKGMHASTDVTIKRLADALGVPPSDLDVSFQA